MKLPRKTTIPTKAPDKMSHDVAMKVLGLAGGAKTKKGVNKRVEDFTEEEVLEAFQTESEAHSKLVIHVIHAIFSSSARKGEFQELQATHEAYQVLVKVIRAKNTFIKKTAQKREENIKKAEHAAVAASVFKKKGLGKNLDMF